MLGKNSSNGFINIIEIYTSVSLSGGQLWTHCSNDQKYTKLIYNEKAGLPGSFHELVEKPEAPNTFQDFKALEICKGC